MTAKFIISPRPGKTTVSLVNHRYVHATRRTRNEYQGSFNLGLDADSLAELRLLRPGQAVAGLRLARNATIELDAEDIMQIRDWLACNGTHARKREAERMQEAQRIEAEAAARRALAAEIEADVRRRLAQERLSGLTARVDDEDWGGDLLRAEAAMLVAAESLSRAAQQARAEGLHLGSVRSPNTDAALARNKLEVLQAHATRLRKVSVAHFEDACKAAGLMACRK